jgi:hypothetical protein
VLLEVGLAQQQPLMLPLPVVVVVLVVQASSKQLGWQVVQAQHHINSMPQTAAQVRQPREQADLVVAAAAARSGHTRTYPAGMPGCTMIT